ncbi:hypothetical protein B0H13DRAFT_1868915 [Mycena leptocephala]|nr:hypothetical protein B0H13DRAFT_1868915 [Mycena leptocephala]
MPPIRHQVARALSKGRRPPHVQSTLASWQVQASEPFGTRIYAAWYADPTLPAPWSTDWDHWGGLFWLFNEKYHNRKVEKLFKDVFDVPGTVEPLAYAQCGIGEYFLFTAGGRYYFYSDGKLTVHRMEFTSPKEFLEHLLQKDDHLPDVTIPMRPGADLGWLYDT